MKLSSSLVGIIILVLSIAFFYMNLAFEYPVDQMRIDTSMQRKEKPADKGDERPIAK